MCACKGERMHAALTVSWFMSCILVVTKNIIVTSGVRNLKLMGSIDEGND
jgi:hypothetical protein